MFKSCFLWGATNHKADKWNRKQKQWCRDYFNVDLSRLFLLFLSHVFVASVDTHIKQDSNNDISVNKKWDFSNHFGTFLKTFLQSDRKETFWPRRSKAVLHSSVLSTVVDVRTASSGWRPFVLGATSCSASQTFWTLIFCFSLSLLVLHPLLDLIKIMSDTGDLRALRWRQCWRSTLTMPGYSNFSSWKCHCNQTPMSLFWGSVMLFPLVSQTH